MATPTTEDCCAAWPKIRAQFKWFEFADEPGVMAMPFLVDTDCRVNHCPVCGASRRMVVWNTHTHPEEAMPGLTHTRQEDFDG